MILKNINKKVLKASKIVNPKHCKYSGNWSFFACYLIFVHLEPTYLSDSQLLPLPHPKTVRQLLSSTKTTCGFDEEFLLLLVKKVQHMPSSGKHGVLLFDEISLRESLQVNSLNLSYIGLKDYGENSTCHKEFSDHTFGLHVEIVRFKFLSNYRSFCF